MRHGVSGTSALVVLSASSTLVVLTTSPLVMMRGRVTGLVPPPLPHDVFHTVVNALATAVVAELQARNHPRPKNPPV